MSVITLFTDGACPNNGKANAIGGWGFLAIMPGGAEFENFGNLPHNPTNNRAELMAFIKGLQFLEGHPEPDILLISDSKYVGLGATTWMPAWKKRGWRTASNKRPENFELWQMVDRLLEARSGALAYAYVQGHSGHPNQERVDKLAVAGAYL